MNITAQGKIIESLIFSLIFIDFLSKKDHRKSNRFQSKGGYDLSLANNIKNQYFNNHENAEAPRKKTAV